LSREEDWRKGKATAQGKNGGKIYSRILKGRGKKKGADKDFGCALKKKPAKGDSEMNWWTGTISVT